MSCTAANCEIDCQTFYKILNHYNTNGELVPPLRDADDIEWGLSRDEQIALRLKLVLQQTAGHTEPVTRDRAFKTLVANKYNPIVASLNILGWKYHISSGDIHLVERK